MNEEVFKSGTKLWITFDLPLLHSRPYQVSGSCAGGSENFLSMVSALYATLLREPGGSKELRKMAEALVLPAFLLRHIRHVIPCLLSSSLRIATARRCLAIGSSGKVKAAPVKDVEKALPVKKNGCLIKFN